MAEETDANFLIPHSDDPSFTKALAKLDLQVCAGGIHVQQRIHRVWQMCMEARVMLVKGFDWLDK